MKDSLTHNEQAPGARAGGAEPSPAQSSSPTVSVVVPAYNAARYVGEALASVFAQTFRDFEVIVVNDGSPDTPELKAALAPYAERIIYLEQKNAGPSAARNAGVRRARARLVAFLDADDAWESAYLDEQLRAFDEDSALDLVYADARIVGDTAHAGKTFMQCHPSRGAVTSASLLREECTVLTSCVVARRQALIDAGLFDENFRRSEDFDLWVRLAHAGARLGYQTKVLARHRRHNSSLTSDYVPMYDSQLQVFAKLCDLLGDGDAHLRALAEDRLRRCEAERDLELGKRAFVGGRFGESSAALARANEFFRSRKLRVALLLLRAAPRLLRRAYLTRYRSSPPDVMIALRR